MGQGLDSVAFGAAYFWKQPRSKQQRGRVPIPSCATGNNVIVAFCERAEPGSKKAIFPNYLQSPFTG